MQWLRLYHDTPTDPKWRLVAVESEQTVATVLAIWTCMLVNASQAAPRGTLQNWNDRVVGACLDLKGSAVTAVREAMQGIVLDGDVLTGWDKRQRTNDSSTERVRRYRERAMLRNQIAEAAAASAGTSGIQSPADTSFSHTAATEDYGVPETVGNGDVTVTSGLVTVTSGNVTVTERFETAGSVFSSARADSDSDTEEEKERIPPYPPMGGMVSGSLPVAVPDEGLLFAAPAVDAIDAVKSSRASRARKKPLYTTSQMNDFFAEFRSAYPPIDMTAEDGGHHWKGARRYFDAAVKAMVDPAALIAAAHRYCHETRANGRYGTAFTKDANNWLKERLWQKYDGVHHFPTGAPSGQSPSGQSEIKFIGDKERPPVGYDDVPVGTRKGWWMKSSRGWTRMAS
jgi:hypothetical protein